MSFLNEEQADLIKVVADFAKRKSLLTQHIMMKQKNFLGMIFTKWLN